jgi:hypothetical protein
MPSAVTEGSGDADDLGPITDEELTELALSCAPVLVPAEDAVPLAEHLGHGSGLLPEWYMPAPTARPRARWRLPVVLVLVGAFVAVEAAGLCSTFGQLVPS